MKILQIWGQKFRSTWYEVRVDLGDEAGRIYHECLTFPGKVVPEKKVITQAVDDLVVRM
jgi:hypothetical protein